LTLTTNGSLLKKKARALKDAGLNRVTVSLDGLDDAIFRRMNDVDFPVADVLDGLAEAQAVGLGAPAHGKPSGLKINMVVKRGTNDHEIVPMARHFQGSGMVLRFIEYMDVGATNGWCMDEVLPSADVVARIHAELPLVQLEPSAPGETAERWGYVGANGLHDPTLGEVGVISSVTQAFCGDCNRARLSTEGKLFLCLFATQGFDLRDLIRGQGSVAGATATATATAAAADLAQPTATADRVHPLGHPASDAELISAIGAIWQQRTDRYSQLRASLPPEAQAGSGKRIEMSYIGG
jgi:cyclic pyranopterin phosphate synthase